MTGLNRSTIADLLGELTSLGLVEERPGRRPRRARDDRRPWSRAGPRARRCSRSISPSTRSRSRHWAWEVTCTTRSGRETARAVLAGRDGARRREAGGAAPRFTPDEARPGRRRRLRRRHHPEVRRLRPPRSQPGLARRPPRGHARRRDRSGRSRPCRQRCRPRRLGGISSREAPGIGDLIYVAGEFGIGAGVIVDGRPLRGSAGYAGEAGHTLINPAGLKCRCGAIGCWETEAGEVALLRHAGLTEGAGRVDEMAELAAAGHEPTLRAIAEVGRWLGFGIGNLINIFNPDLVILGGLYERLFTYLEPSVVEGARSGTLDPSRELGDDRPQQPGSRTRRSSEPPSWCCRTSSPIPPARTAGAPSGDPRQRRPRIRRVARHSA